MKSSKIYTVVSLVILAIIGFYFFDKYNVAPKINISQLQVVDKQNQSFDFTRLKGKKVIISFYASWCPNCIDELKVLNKINSEKLNGVTVLCITDESIDKMISFRDKKQYPFTFLKLVKPFNEIGINSIPTVYLMNTNNEIVYDKVGYVDWEDESTLSHLIALMD